MVLSVYIEHTALCVDDIAVVLVLLEYQKCRLMSFFLAMFDFSLPKTFRCIKLQSHNTQNTLASMVKHVFG